MYSYKGFLLIKNAFIIIIIILSQMTSGHWNSLVPNFPTPFHISNKPYGFCGLVDMKEENCNTTTPQPWPNSQQSLGHFPRPKLAILFLWM